MILFTYKIFYYFGILLNGQSHPNMPLKAIQTIAFSASLKEMQNTNGTHVPAPS
jgi:hypothetical protein